MKYTYGTLATGVHRMVVVVALLQYLTAPLQSSLKYCQVVAQVVHQVVTMITAVEAKAEIMA
jgi:membrane glycosyltransferase